MPLYLVEDLERQVDFVPFQAEFNKMRARLTDEEHDAILRQLNGMVDGDEIHTSSWMPGSDWSGTVFHPIYLAARKNEQTAARFFGLVVWRVFMDRPEDWGSGRYEKNGVPLTGRTYFRITRHS